MVNFFLINIFVRFDRLKFSIFFLSFNFHCHHLQEYEKNDKKIVAVEGTTMDLYEGQISALLGQNGAGKTTTMNMIVGVF